jgi:hypothetical protein
MEDWSGGISPCLVFNHIMEVDYMYSLFVGIDVSKDSFSVCGLDEKENAVFSLVAAMDKAGFSEFMKAISLARISLMWLLPWNPPVHTM